MKRRMSAFLVAMALLAAQLLAGVPRAMAAEAGGELILKVHYHREDANYENWTVWLWELGGGDAIDAPLVEEDGEMVATMTVTPGIASVGYIVRQSDWTKDVDMDQFIDISEMVSGTVHVYVESGVEGHTKEYGGDAVLGTKPRSALYNHDGTITVTMTGEIEGSLDGVFSVEGKDGGVAVSDVAEGGGEFTYTVTLAQELDPFKSYSIIYDGAQYKLSIPSLYSTEGFEKEYTYTGDDLGAVWTKDATTFRVWAPTAESVTLNLYASGKSYQDDKTEEIEMARDANGTWVAAKSGDLNGVYYTYTAVIDGVAAEACDPYARTTGVNGVRAMVIDLDGTDPEGWESDANPHAGESINDAVIYELHVRDLSVDADSGIQNAGKFLGLTETGTKTPGGVSTGLDHMKELGITHLHLLPIYDFGSVDETHTTASFNWGYDPVNYNVPEGSYSTDPFNGEVRVKELKQTVKALHENGISVVMDVVYNHVQDAGKFCFNRLVPGYFSRINADGSYSNGSGCGNDTASERSMVRKFIVDSVRYWADEYHIDGFRFDLVGLLDTQTVNEIVAEVHKDHPDVIFYGEGWTMSTNVTKEGYTMATQVNSQQTPGFAYFNDTIRDGLKGSVFDDTDPGFASGKAGMEDVLSRCFLGADTWCASPAQTVNYASCHDNLTLFDHLQTARPEAGREELVRMNNLAAAFYMMAEGVPFLQAGEEMLRTKLNDDGSFNSNSYNANDQVNCLKWGDLDDEAYRQVFEYYKGLIAFRKAHGALRLGTAQEVSDAVSVVGGLDANVLAFAVKGGVNGETAEGLYLIFNANETSATVNLPEGNWNVYINGEKAGVQALASVSDGSVEVEPVSALVLVKESAAAAPGTQDGGESGKAGTGLYVGIAAAALLACGGGVFVALNKKRK